MSDIIDEIVEAPAPPPPPLPADKTPIPANDGVDHINVYSRGHTQLGQALSNFSHYAIDHPKYGFFASLEAFWFWLSSGKQHNDLRRLYGSSARTLGLKKLRVDMDKDEFEREIGDAIRLKISQNRQLAQALKKSTLPFRHYYVYGTNPPVIREKSAHKWQMELLEQIRTDLKLGRSIKLSDGSPTGFTTILEVVENPMPEEAERVVREED